MARLSDIAKASAEFRAYQTRVSLAANIIRRLDYYRKAQRTQIRWSHQVAATRTAKLLDVSRRIPTDQWELVVWVISTYLTRRVMEFRARDIMADIFKGLPQPGRAQHNDLEKMLIEQMNDYGQTTRANTAKFLLMCEMAYRCSQQWYMVFNTLTVDREYHDKVFSKHSRLFSNYVRKIDNRVAAATFGTIRKKDGSDYHTYFACVEEGSETGRLHIHVLHFMRQLPQDCEDPNKALSKPRLREINALKIEWSYGWSAPISVRYSPKDPYGMAGWRWPIDSKTNEPMVIGSPLRVATYMSKYITKGYNSCNREILLWRVRKTQNLGRKLLQMCISEIKTENLLKIAENDLLTFRWNRVKVPAPILRLTALREYNRRCSQNQSLTTLMEEGKHTTPRPSPLHSLRDSTRRRDASNPQNTTRSTIQNSGDTEEYEASIELTDTAERYENQYFHYTAGKYGTTSTDDHALYANGALA